MAHVLVYYILLVVIIICIMFVKFRKGWRMLQSAVRLGTPENSSIQKLSIIILLLLFSMAIFKRHHGSEGVNSCIYLLLLFLSDF